jgi:molecular chaperone HscB
MNQRKGSGRRGGPDTVKGDMVSCWLCSRPVSPRALFCHHCGTVQAPAALDPFTRLGLPIRFDIDTVALERQITGFRRTLAPERFAAKGPREKANAGAQLAAFQHAYDTVRDPIRRARHLLDLADTAGTRSADAFVDFELDAIEKGVTGTAEVAELDRLANLVTGDIQSSILDLAAAFRSGDLAAAAREVNRLERLEALANIARVRRPSLSEGAS